MRSTRVSVHAVLLFVLFSLASSSFGAPVAGDVDTSGTIDAADVQMVINGALNLPVSGTTDINFDAATDAVDVQLVINAVLGIMIDTDGDGLCDAGEAKLCCDVNIADTDRDSVGDGQEMLDDTDPCGDDGRPILFPLPKVTTDSTVTVHGCAESADGIIIRGGVEEVVDQTASDSCFFAIPVDLSIGTNELRVYGESGGMESHPAYAQIVRAEPSLVLDDITPDSGQSGTIATLTGSGFVPDKDVMTAYFKGSRQEAEGKTLEVTATSMTVVVPFVFLDTDEDIDIYVYSSSQVSNSVAFHVTLPSDPTPDTPGNEMAAPFDAMLVEVQMVRGKLEQLVQPYITEDVWTDLDENLRRLEEFIELGQAEMLNVHDDEMLARLDSIFGSDVFLLILERLEEMNEILSHSTDGEALCNVSEVIGILDDIIDVLDWVYWALRAGEVICFFVCQPALPVLEVAVQVVDAVRDILKAIKAVLDATMPTKAEPASWWLDMVGPYPGVDPHLMFTESTNTQTLYADLSNGSFNDIVSEVSTLGGIVLDLLDIDLGRFEIEDVAIPSTISIHSTDPDYPGNTPSSSPLMSIVDQQDDDLDVLETHTIVTNVIPDEGIEIAEIELDIQSSCSHYHYPQGYVGGVALGSPPQYPEFFDIEMIEAPIVDGMEWSAEWMGWYIWGKGFSTDCGDVFKVYWNGEEVPCDCIDTLDFDSFHATCTYFDQPGRIEIVLVDPDDPDNEDKQRHGPTISVGPSPYESLTVSEVVPSSGYIGDILTVMGDNFSPYIEDMTLRLFVTGETSPPDIIIHPLEISAPWGPGAPDYLTFRIPEDLHGLEGKTIEFELRLEISSAPVATGGLWDFGEFELRHAKSAAWADQDLMAFQDAYSYLRTAVIGDLDGDGENDLVVGVPEYRIPGRAIGAVYIVFGPVEGTPLPTGQQYLDFGDSRQPWDVVIIGHDMDLDPDGNSRRIGQSLAVGDINGDGIDDLLIGTTDRDDHDYHQYNIMLEPFSPTHRPGKAYVFYGRPRQNWYGMYWIHRTIQGNEDFDLRIHGDDDRELGYRVALGDLNNDGFADMIVSAPTEPIYPTLPNETIARSYVIFGNSTLATDIDVSDIPGSVNGVVLTGEDVWQEPAEDENYKGTGLGKGLAVGDIDGDGIDDLVVGAPQFRRPYEGYLRQGAAYLFYGGDSFGGDGSLTVGLWEGDQDVHILGPTLGSAENGEIGRPLGIGDLNNDGKGEIILGAPDTKLDYQYSYAAAVINVEENNIGRVYVVDGAGIPQTGRASVDTLGGLVVHGATTISRFGVSLATGDVDGDGINDLLAGAPGRLGSPYPGRVWGMYGSEEPGRIAGTIHLTDRTGDPDDFLYAGTWAYETYDQGFGTFVTTGDLSPYIGDDVIIIDPLTDSPDPLDPPQVHEYSGMLYEFYEGSTGLRPLVMFPDSATMSSCDSQQYFIVSGGIGPYTFSLTGLTIPDAAELESTGTRSALLSIDDCDAGGYTQFSVKVVDGNGSEVGAPITVLSGPAPIDFNDFVTGEIGNEGDENGYNWNCISGFLTLDLVETDGDQIIDDDPPIRAMLLDQDDAVVHEEVGGFSNIESPDTGVCSLVLRSESSTPIEYGFTLYHTDGGPLAITPDSVTMAPCDSEQTFTASGGTPPYTFVGIAVYTVGISMEDLDKVEYTDFGDGSATLHVDGCMPEGTKLGLTVQDSAGAIATGTFTFTADEVTPGEMVVVPAGSFEMGRRDDEDGGEDELPRHNVYLDAYQIGKYEVTNGEYVDVLNWALAQGYLEDSTGGQYTGGPVYTFGRLICRLTDSPGDSIVYSAGTFDVRDRNGHPMADHPVVNMSWYGAVAYCSWLSIMEGLTPCYDPESWERIEPVPNGYRLPTEAEWERAAAWDPGASPSHWIFSFQSDIINSARCNYGLSNPFGFTDEPYTTPVGYYNGVNTGTEDSPSPAGCYDMSGNVWEWCHDRWGLYSSGDQSNPTGPPSGDNRVLRSGGWGHDAASCRSAYRFGESPTGAYNTLGFRIVRTAVQH